MGGKSNNQNGGSNRSSGSEFSLVTLTAVLHHYNPDTLKWIVVGPSRIGIYHDPEANSFRIVARRLAEEGHEVVANCPVGEHFSYNESTPTFHQWRDAGVQVMGVKFSSTDEGALFADTVRRILATFESVARMMLESGALAEEQLPHPSHPHNSHPHQHQYLPLNHHHHQQYQQYQQSPPQNPPPPVPGGGSSTSSSSSNGGSLYGGSGDQPAHFAAAPMRGKPVPPPPPPPNGSCKNGGGQLNQAKPAIQPKPGFLNEMEITLARRRAKIEAADGNGNGGGSQVEIGLTGREQQVVHLPLRANSTSELQQQQHQPSSLSSFSGVNTFLNKSINGLHPSSSFSNPSSPSIELLPTGNNSSNGLSSAQLPPLAIEKLKQEILGEIRQEFAAFKMDLLQVIKEQMSSQG